MSELKEKDVKELKDAELDKAVGGLDVYSDENTITMYFSSNDNPSELLFKVKNHADKVLGCYFDQKPSNDLQNLLNEMTNTKKTYLKINYVRDGLWIKDISLNTMF